MKSSEILREAQKLIKDGTRHYICNALLDVARKDSVHIRVRILNAISPCAALEGWLVGRVPVDELAAATPDDYRAYRLALIDLMIEGYEAIGD